MITQHVVSYGDDVTVTRLPAGRAEGYVWLSFVWLSFVWLSFVARGVEVTTGPDDMWRLTEHVVLKWFDGSTAEVLESETTGNERLHRLDLTIRDPGYNTITISYVEGDEVISSENVALPDAPDT